MQRAHGLVYLFAITLVLAGCARQAPPRMTHADREKLMTKRTAMRMAALTPDKTEAEVASTRTCLLALYPIIQEYRRSHGGQLPKELGELHADMVRSPSSYSHAWSELQCTGIRHAEGKVKDDSYWEHLPLTLVNTRPNGDPVGGPKLEGTRDVIAGRLFPSQSPTQIAEQFAMVLWEDGKVDRIPYRRWKKVPVAGTENKFRTGFAGQAGLPVASS